VDDFYFTLIEFSDFDGAGRYQAGPSTAGPWARDLQHGGPPSALAVAAAEQAVTRETGRTDLRAARLAADFVRPVPVGDLVVRSRLLRAARSAALAEVVIADSAARECLLGRVWFVRDSDTAAVAPPLGEIVEVPDGRPGLTADFPYGRSLEWRFVAGRFDEPGPSAAWVRPRTGLLDGYEMSALTRAVLIADSASGISAELSWQEWTFLNVDLDVHMSRPVVGEWLLMDATTHLGPHGTAVARSTLSDVHGVCGAGLQTLVLAPTRR
jgi:acyl-coenzyme A thioesterase PaaI-like protein